MWCRWKTARTNSRGKPIYLRKYYHGVMVGGSDEPGRDEVNHTQRDALQLTAEYLLAGSAAWPPLAGPDGVIPGSIATSRFITTRTLKRRGKRPH